MHFAHKSGNLLNTLAEFKESPTRGFIKNNYLFSTSLLTRVRGTLPSIISIMF